MAKKTAKKRTAKSASLPSIAESIQEVNWPRQCDHVVQQKILDAVKRGKAGKRGNGYPTTLREGLLGWHVVNFPTEDNLAHGRFAGYTGTDTSVRNTASARKRKIRQYIADLVIERNKVQTASKARIDAELGAAAFYDIGDYYRVEVDAETGEVTHRPRTLDEISPIARRAIKKVELEKGRVVGFEFYDKLNALDKLMHSLGMKQPEFLAAQVGTLIQNKQTINIDMKNLSDEELDALRFSLAKAIPDLREIPDT